MQTGEGGRDETLLAHASWTLSSFKRILFPTHAKDKTGQDLVLARGTHRTIIARGAFGVSFRTHAFPDAGAVRSRRHRCLCVCVCVALLCVYCIHIFVLPEALCRGVNAPTGALWLVAGHTAYAEQTQRQRDRQRQRHTGQKAQAVCPKASLYVPSGHSAHLRTRLRMTLLSESAISSASVISSRCAGAFNEIGGELHSQFFWEPGAGSLPNSSALHGSPIRTPSRSFGAEYSQRSPAEVP